MKRMPDLEPKAPEMMLESCQKMIAKRLMIMMMKMMMIERMNNISHKGGLILKADMKFKDKCKNE